MSLSKEERDELIELIGREVRKQNEQLYKGVRKNLNFIYDELKSHVTAEIERIFDAIEETVKYLDENKE